ncbi:M17 family metallopeptidase [Actinomadura alba]|uniref:Probable cytosol aminopeptidase n=1 Tax=Actinomadura alba TaxID=406431 RepID=A0ABR7LWK2_9ACTN|nr:leucyl aminopeptidase family protein [Actinomadura alba]MBC6469232.1 leucyl aminopeptidase family protein [Actinomadura alba]
MASLSEQPFASGSPTGPGTARGRDHRTEIEAAVAAAASGTGSVQLLGSGRATRTVRGVTAENASGFSQGWLPFAGAPGELSVAGDTLLVGLGCAADSTPETLRVAGTAAGAVIADGDVLIELPECDADNVRAWIDGLVSGIRPDRNVRLTLDTLGGSVPDAAREGLIAAQASRLASLLTSAPANVVTPGQAALWARDIAVRAELQCSILDDIELRDRGFGGLTAIGCGSVNGPRLVQLRYDGTGDGPSITLAGKGITFDSGGLSLKSPDAMQSMRSDVAGAAVVLAVMAVLGRLGVRATVRAILPFAENLPGPGSARPGDVVSSYDGTQIQILDTDFEGRVVLADALALAVEERPDLVIDMATLTYQAVTALGPEIGAVISPDDSAAEALLSASAAAGEPMWRLPWAPRYLDQVRTASGVRNHPLRSSGRALTAALFLGEFVPRDIPWVHCDFAGPAWAGDASCDGATGFGTRTLLRLLARQ